MTERKVAGDRCEVTVYVGAASIVVGINGPSSNPGRHATTLTPTKARELAKLLNAAADLA